MHRETRQDNVFVLVLAKGGSKLQVPKDTTRSGVASGRTGGYGPGPPVGYCAQGFNASMVQIARELESVMRRPVLARVSHANGAILP
jgi:uncharacterized protein (TIGR03435 family)